MSDNLKTLLWHYKKTSKNTLFMDIFLLIFSSIIFLQKLNLVYIFVIYLMVYSINNNNVLDLSNSVLVGTPIKIKNVIDFNSFIIWLKATILILLGCAVSLFIKTSSMTIVVNIFSYIVFAYAFLNFIFASKYFISKSYRGLVFFLLAGVSVLIFFLSITLNFGLKMVLFMALTVTILIVSRILIKKLSFEKILGNEEKQ